MALSQLQCLDDNHVNPRTNESKPEFLYCEDQRLALEILLRDGRDAFFKYLDSHGLRGFLSDPELESLCGATEPYDPGSERFPDDGEEGDAPLSLHYWPELSDTSVPKMDLGWPDSQAYRGVTRTTIYTQPPLDGHVHIKEVIRRMIAQAQKVIAVVMDVFTDVDIFRDLLDVGFKKKVSVYILLERTSLPHFLSMCQRANMHTGHLKNLRVRCSEGTGFYTHSSTKVRGRMGHRFMFIDGDKAVSGSYSFTWMSSRLDRNLITVVTGQAVEAFDRLFCILFMNSTFVELRQVAMEPEPEPEMDYLPQPATMAIPSAAVAMKLYNPKYALAFGNSSPVCSPNPTAGQSRSQENSRNPEVPDPKKRKQRRDSKDTVLELPPIHPGLANLEKVCLIPYLPTWPEPDPPSDVIGFINIRDTRKPLQVHLQRSEMFETSQAIRFSSPISIPKEIPLEVAKPSCSIVKQDEINKPAQDKTKAQESMLDRVQPKQVNAWSGHIKTNASTGEKKLSASGMKCESIKNPLNTEDDHSKTPTIQDEARNTTSTTLQHTPQTKESTPNPKTVRLTVQAVPILNPMPDSLPGLNTKKAETNLNSHSNNAVTKVTTDQNAGQHMQRVLPHNDSYIKNFEITSNIQTSTTSSQPVTSTSFSESVSVNGIASVPLSISPLLPSSSPTLSPPSSSSSKSLTSACPIPKPRTFQLVIKDHISNDGQKCQEFSVVKRPQAAQNEPTLPTDMQNKWPQKESEILQNNNGNKNEGEIGEAPQMKQTQETKNEEGIGLRDGRARLKLVTGTNRDTNSGTLIIDKTKETSVNIPEEIVKDIAPTPKKSTPQTTSVATLQVGTPKRVLTGLGFDERAKGKSKNVTDQKTHFSNANALQRMSSSALTTRDPGVLQTTGHTPVSTTHKPGTSIAGDHTSTNAIAAELQQSNSRITTGQHREMEKHPAQSASQEMSPKARASVLTPERSLCLNLSDRHRKDLCLLMPDRESRSLSPLVRTPTPDGVLPRTSTPDSQIHTLDARSHTPDVRMPMSDISDGYVSPRTNSTLSTTSEEYFECSDSPFHEVVFDQPLYFNYTAREDRICFTYTNTPNASASLASMSNINITDSNNSCNEIQSLSRAVSTSSSLLGEKETKVEERKKGKEDLNDVDLKFKVERRTKTGSIQTQRKSSKKSKSTGDVIKHGTEKYTEAQSKDPPKKSHSKAEQLVDGKLTSETTEPKQLSTGDFKAKKTFIDRERPDRTASREQRKGRLHSTKENGEQKVSHTPLKQSQGPQQDNGGYPPPQFNSSKPLPGTHLSCPLSQKESKNLHDSFQVTENTMSPCRPPFSSPSPVVENTAQKLTEAPHNQQTAKAGQSPNQHPHTKPQSPSLHRHSNVLPEYRPHSQKQMASAEEAQCHDEGNTQFSLTFNRLYSLKDKINKLSARSKSVQDNSATQTSKSTS